MLVLASQSASRKAMLKAAGVSFTAIPAAVDERALEASLTSAAPEVIVLALAEAKALAVSAARGEALVLGSDSLVSIGGRRFDKPRDRNEAAEHLRYFSGREMHLHSAAVLARGGAAVWRLGDCAVLQVRALSEDFIVHYLDLEWPAVAGCAGVFRIEDRGVQLFESIKGDHFTVLGMPLLPVLGALRDHGALHP
jgi:septum formation protein